MTRLFAHRSRPPGGTYVALVAGLLGLAAVAIRVHNALRYPPDWGFDASFNWKYIYELSQRWSLPDPRVHWSTGDPPLFFYASALIMRGCEAASSRGHALVAVPLLGTAAGLAIVALAMALVRSEDSGEPRRALLAGGLLLFLPAHIQMSPMVNEEMLAALFTSIVAFALARRGLAGADGGLGVGRAGGVGLAAGLALLTKLSGALAGITAAATYALDGWRSGAGRLAAMRVAAVLLAATLAGGWFYARNQVKYGFLQPHGLPAHQIMFSMPPGQRSIADYLRVPLATWTDPQLLHPDLLHSVWGSTYATVWFDGHRYFLPKENEAVRRLGTLTLLLALLPTVAFAIGLSAGLRRALRCPRGADAPLLLLVGLTLAGYVLYTWHNPWFAVVKGTSLLGLSLPFAFYASEVLARWTRRRRAVSLPVWLLLAALVVCVTSSATFNLAFEKTEVSGLPWEEVEAP